MSAIRVPTDVHASPTAPQSHAATDGRRPRDPEALAAQLRAALGDDAVYRLPEDVIVYEYDYGMDRGMPDLAVIPSTTEQVQAAVRLARAAGVPIVPRGAGTGIAGGAIPRHGGLVISTARLNRVMAIDVPNRCAVVQPGVVNLELSKLTEPLGLFFAPDPSSQKASTIGGNVGNNAGGPHCLSLGVTANHILGVEMVLEDGTLVRFGGKSSDSPGLDLTGLTVGSEGTIGIVTEVTVKLLPLPEAIRTTLAIFPSVAHASEAVSAVIGRGIVPAALEMMDRLALTAIEAAFHAGYPPEAGAVLLVEVDGLREQVEVQARLVDELCRAAGATEIRVAETASDRAKLWAGRKGAASAMGRIAPNYYLHDAVVRRTRLPEILARVVETAERYSLPIANLFHAGDGNLHPMILYDAREPGIMDRVLPAGNEILQACVEAGGTITGEHGVGVEKQRFMPLIFSADDLDVMGCVRHAFDPDERMNPDKVLPLGAGCLDAAVTAPVSRRTGPGQRPPAITRPGEEALWV